jgi:hypothetical protein
MNWVRASSAVLAGLVVLTGTAQAQSAAPTPPQVTRKVDAEARVDGIIARTSALQFGVGLSAPIGVYTRPGADAALGFSRHGLSGRVDLFTRFHFDPFRQSRWAPYGGGGVSGRFETDEKAKAYLLIFLGLDGPVSGGMSPSFEVGLGGGARVGVLLRQARPNMR